MAASGPPPELSATHVLRRRGAVTLLVRRDWEAALPLETLLEGAPPAAWGEPLPHDLRGRGRIEVVDTGRGVLVAKRLTRGGLAGGLLRDLFLDRWRCAREAAVAEALAARGCPMPPVVLVRATRRGALFALELATAREDGARDLLAALEAGRDDRSAVCALARSAGRTLRRLHDAGLRHRDLQVKNLLVPPGAGPDEPLVVIDLDRCTLGPPLDGPGRVASLTRFTRSLVKRGLLPRRGEAPHPLVPGALRAFLGGYGASPAGSRARLAAAVAGRLRRSLWVHQWRWGRADERLATGAR